MGANILIVEDDPHVARIAGLYLRRDGHAVTAVADGPAGLRAAAACPPDLVVLDLMLPGLDGFSVCRRLRAISNVPVIMLTARTAEPDRLAGLDLGADDYMTKPFSPRELAARVRAVLRRVEREAGRAGPERLERGGLTLVFKSHVARAGCITLPLTPTEFRLLSLLARDPGRVFSRARIISRVFGYEFNGLDRTVDAHIANLRRKLGAAGDGVGRIETVYGVGYRFATDSNGK